jgi:hypothetical protein
MAGTTASEINDLFLTRINDYRLDAIFTTSGSAAFTLYLEPWLLDAIVEFSPICDQSLVYTVSTGGTEGSFSVILTLENQIMLSKLMVLSWLGQSVKEVLQFNLFLQDADYRTHAASSNLSAKQSLYNNTREELSQSMNEYSFRKNDWSSWISQDYGTA